MEVRHGTIHAAKDLCHVMMQGLLNGKDDFDLIAEMNREKKLLTLDVFTKRKEDVALLLGGNNQENKGAMWKILRQVCRFNEIQRLDLWIEDQTNSRYTPKDDRTITGALIK